MNLLLLLIFPLFILLLAGYFYYFRHELKQWLDFSQQQLLFFSTLFLMSSITGIILALINNITFYLIWILINLCITLYLVWTIYQKIK